MQTGEIRVFPFLCRPVELGGLPLFPARFLIALFLLTRFLTVPFSACGLACSCDDALLSGAVCR